MKDDNERMTDFNGERKKLTIYLKFFPLEKLEFQNIFS